MTGFSAFEACKELQCDRVFKVEDFVNKGREWKMLVET